MELTFTCQKCRIVGRVAPIQSNSEARCSSCGTVELLRADAVVDQQLRACPLCATTDLYLQKDFPQGLGLAILIVGFAISTVFWYFQRPLETFAVLIASVALDWWLYGRVPNVTICYRCLAQVRGPGADGGGHFNAFDLAIGERYRQERIRIEELRTARAAQSHPDAPRA